ncbi:MAG TPA: potassium-transporting ATPase subunit KdpA, partial [Pseudolysinimonas sp.]|nr:potassium-transporting ATPase subunit KdpA [Pseudolysinimonas sp.]
MAPVATEWLLFAGEMATLIVLLGVGHVSLGDYMARVYTGTKHLKVELGFYRAIGAHGDSEQSWGAYLRSVLAFSVIGVLIVYLFQRIQTWLPWALGLPQPSEPLSFNTAISFVTNTNWQSYSPDVTLGYSVQLAALAVQNFVSAAVGIAVAIALVRGLSRRRTGTIGNFWVDLTRGVVRILLPISVV